MSKLLDRVHKAVEDFSALPEGRQKEILDEHMKRALSESTPEIFLQGVEMSIEFYKNIPQTAGEVREAFDKTDELLTLSTLSFSALPEEPSPWKESRPADRLVFSSDGTNVIILDYIGPALDYWHEMAGSEFDTCFEGEPPGIWLWEGTIKTYGDSGWDYEEELEGVTRPLTKDEWEEYRCNGEFWNPADWRHDDSDQQ